jgi:uncharacterized protein (TIGR00251 family)
VIQYTEKDGAFVFAVRVIPQSSKSQIVGEMDGALKVKINAPAVNGAANAELIKFLAKQLKIAKSAIEITNGQTSRRKQVRIGGVNRTNLLNLIGG